MSDPITLLDAAMQAQWTQRGYTATPLLYGFREAARTRELGAVLLGAGRIVYHWGVWTTPEASAGALEKPHGHAHRAGRDYAVAADVFTVHCHGYDAAFPEATAPGAERAHDAAAWLLRQHFFGVLQWVVRSNSWLLEYGSQTLVRDPAERRIGELLRAEFSVRFSLREAPEHPFQYPEQKPVGAVVGASGQQTKVVEVP